MLSTIFNTLISAAENFKQNLQTNLASLATSIYAFLSSGLQGFLNGISLAREKWQGAQTAIVQKLDEGKTAALGMWQRTRNLFTAPPVAPRNEVVASNPAAATHPIATAASVVENLTANLSWLWPAVRNQVTAEANAPIQDPATPTVRNSV